MYQLSFYVPATHLEQVKKAVFAAGGGHIGDYDCCAWQTAGTGQFRPQEGADPYLGAIGEVEKVEEYKVEMVCSEQAISSAISAMKHTHPYEEPAYHVVRLESL